MFDSKLFVSLTFVYEILVFNAKCNKVNLCLFLLIKAKSKYIALRNFPCKYNFTLVIICCRDGIFFHLDLNTNPIS